MVRSRTRLLHKATKEFCMKHVTEFITGTGVAVPEINMDRRTCVVRSLWRTSYKRRTFWNWRVNWTVACLERDELYAVWCTARTLMRPMLVLPFYFVWIRVNRRVRGFSHQPSTWRRRNGDIPLAFWKLQNIVHVPLLATWFVVVSGLSNEQWIREEEHKYPCQECYRRVPIRTGM
jgi:hypothetical protein